MRAPVNLKKLPEKKATQTMALRNISRPLTDREAYIPSPLPPRPELPQSLIDEFRTVPSNYSSIPALSHPDQLQKALLKWNELGRLEASSIVQNATSPIDYNMRVAENDLKSGFGQVDRNGKLNGIGREVQDFIYEGQFSNNVYHGWGRFINHLGVYWGTWSQGLRNGRGKFVGQDGRVQEGNWVMG